ncbi:MAG: YggS family pyridoxal phosphate-dependent enzyme [Gemmatimonadetes bacterium]|nr:YggS family pyridoxal phosphate-dependent enzyme [Gemmatimonadota bacterium]
MYARIVGERLPRVQERLILAAEKSGRSPESVRIVAVTKGHPPGAVDAVLRAGVCDLGENRVEELEQKFPMFDGRGAIWHMIGHLQSRKAARAAAIADLIHSVDSVRLAERLDRAAAQAGARLDVLIQVNTSGEATKGGLAAEGALDEIGRIAELDRLNPIGLMTMAPFTSDESTIRSTFRSLRRLGDEARSISGFTAKELSMGMSNDFEIAIEEGSTMVRLGTALLGERQA